jgi:hypothetical protein
MVGTFFCLAPTKDQISSHWTRLAFTLRTCSSCSLAQNVPASTSSLKTVLIDTSATREIDRMDDPSHSMERIWTRLLRGSLFMREIQIDFVVKSIKYRREDDKKR